MMNKDQESKDGVNQLNSFLRGEISAAETYRQALEKVRDPTARSVLNEARECHMGRMIMLQQKVRECGGEPASDSGVWGTFAKLVQGAAMPLGESAAIAVLEEGEDHGLRDYRADMSKLDPATQQWFQNEIMSRQQDTHMQLSKLKHSMSAQAQM